MAYIIGVDKEEAMMVDYLITLHSWDLTIFERLTQDDILNLRKQLGRILVAKEMCLTITTESIMLLLLTIVPITYRFGTKDIGLSLKTKLFKAYLKIPVEILEEKKEEEKQNVSNNDQNETFYGSAD